MPQDDQTVRCLGSAYYLAPEQLGTSPEKASPATDAWSLGVTMFRFLTGFWFERANRRKCLDVLADYALPWQSLIDRLCAERPEARLGTGGFRALTVAWPDASRPRRRGVLLGAVCLGELAAVAALLLLCQTNPVSAPAPEEESVRTNVLRLIDRYVAGDCFKNAPDWLRTWHTVLFAVVALDCQDEALAERMIKKIPDRWTQSIFLYTIAGRARIVSRLEELFKRPQEEKQDMEERHANL